MGLLRFLLPSSADPALAERAYLTSAGPDGIPWLSRLSKSPGGFAIERSADESACLHCGWPVAGHGVPTLSTGSLMERDEPYHLPVELARGTLHRLRNQIAFWQGVGLVVSDATHAKLHEATAAFIEAATAQRHPDDAARHADRALAAALDATRLLVREYSEQAIATRRRQTAKLVTLLAGRLEAPLADASRAAAFRQAFNTAVVPLSWRELEPNTGEFDWAGPEERIAWCKGQNIKVCSAPIVQLDKLHVPDWMYLWDDDYEAVQSFVLTYVKATVEQLKGKINLWQAAARMNLPDVLRLSEEQRLRIVVQVLAVLNDLDPRCPRIVSFDRPWGEYCGQTAVDLTPLHFADALVRAELGLSGLALEVNLGYWPEGTLPRDLLEFSRHLDRWSSFNLPLLVTLTAPSAATPDAKASRASAVVPYGFGTGTSATSQRELIAELVPLLLSKPAVQGIVWNQFDDGEPHEYPHGGLVDAGGRAKPALAELGRLRGEFLV
jgi:hypothetical protein